MSNPPEKGEFCKRGRDEVRAIENQSVNDMICPFSCESEVDHMTTEHGTWSLEIWLPTQLFCLKVGPLGPLPLLYRLLLSSSPQLATLPLLLSGVRIVEKFSFSLGQLMKTSFSESDRPPSFFFLALLLLVLVGVSVPEMERDWTNRVRLFALFWL